MRAHLASLTQAIMEALPFSYWLTLSLSDVHRLFADSPRKRKPQRAAGLTELLQGEG